MIILLPTVLITGRHRQIKRSRTMRVGRHLLLRMRRQMGRTIARIMGARIMGSLRNETDRKDLTGLRHRINRGLMITRRHRTETGIGTAITTGIANHVTTCMPLRGLQLHCRQVNRFWCA